MGLDIVAYKNLKPVSGLSWDTEDHLSEIKDYWNPGDSMKWSEKHFPGRGAGIDPDTTYSYEDQYCFRPGSYSGYNTWRELLFCFSKNKGDAFYEIINFADNEGVIGPIVSKKLLNDFNKYYEEALEYAKQTGHEKWFISKYEDWMKAFEYASCNGAINFE